MPVRVRRRGRPRLRSRRRIVVQIRPRNFRARDSGGSISTSTHSRFLNRFSPGRTKPGARPAATPPRAAGLRAASSRRGQTAAVARLSVHSCGYWRICAPASRTASMNSSKRPLGYASGPMLSPPGMARRPELQATRRRVSLPRTRCGRIAQGSVQAAVLAGLADGHAKTPSMIAARTGLRRTTIASTLPAGERRHPHQGRPRLSARARLPAPAACPVQRPGQDRG